jgi:photosynthetic reaction center H subunit
MGTGALTGYFDVAQVVLYVFWLFFAGLIYYLVRENKREGYPLENERSDRITVQGWPPIPAPKTFLLRDGTTFSAPNRDKPEPPYSARPTANWLGAPIEPVGDPMKAGVGPGGYAMRADVPDLGFDGLPKIVPLRGDPDHEVASDDPDPRGKPVIGADGKVGGTVVDLWVDRSEAVFRYMEVEVPAAGGSKRVLVPMNFTRVNYPGGLFDFATGTLKGRKTVIKVKAILGSQFADVPTTRNPDLVTLLEEEKIMAYFGAGTLYAMAARQEPLI